MTNEFPKKWKDTINPFDLPLKKVKITSISGYPYGANQVFAFKGIKDEKEKQFILKYADHIDANIKNEVETLSKIRFNNVPKVIEYDSDYKYLILEFLEGEKLSTIVGDNKRLESLEYMFDYGKMLGVIHKQDNNFSVAPKRRFHDIPNENYFKELDLLYVYNYLHNNKPTSINKCFIHGDFHYANILWKNHKINAILDFELSGIGNKEFDIAWALILRPEQKFLKTDNELEEFLKGYQSENKCDKDLVKYYMTLIYSRFIAFGNDEYEQYIKDWLKRNIINQSLND